jgi:hypothetical protein
VRRNKRVADGANPARARRSQQRTEHRGEHVRVLMRVNVSWGDAGGLEATDLRDGLGFDLSGVQLPGEGFGRDGAEVDREVSVRGGERGQLRRRQDGITVHHDQVASNAELRGCGRLGRLGECATVGHQRCRSDDTVAMSMDNGAIDSEGESEVVGVNDETAHGESLAGGAADRTGADRSTGFRYTDKETGGALVPPFVGPPVSTVGG